MDDYTPSLAAVIEIYALSDPHNAESRAEAAKRALAAHDRVVAANAWDEGFDAGERDVLEHEAGNFDSPCIPNPYRITEENN